MCSVLHFLCTFSALPPKPQTVDVRGLCAVGSRQAGGAQSGLYKGVFLAAFKGSGIWGSGWKQREVSGLSEI